MQNLEALNAQYLLVKNIDNVQHFSQRQLSIENWQFLLGLQIEVRNALRGFLEHEDREGLLNWNERMGMFAQETLAGLTTKEWKEVLNRPLRVCGMVRNNGQPGGGPFFVEMNGVLSKQIVEKAQLTCGSFLHLPFQPRPMG